MKKELVCINCPMGCRLTVTLEDGRVVSVMGNHCRRGESYALQEAVQPMRVLTGNMKAQGCPTPFSVRTDRPVPKAMLLKCAMELKRHHPQLPVRMGDLVLADVCGTGANVVATSNLELPS